MGCVEERFCLGGQRTDFTIQRTLVNDSAKGCIGLSGLPFLRVEIQSTITSIRWQFSIACPAIEQQVGEIIDAICSWNTAGNADDYHRGISNCRA